MHVQYIANLYNHPHAKYMYQEGGGRGGGNNARLKGDLSYYVALPSIHC